MKAILKTLLICLSAVALQGDGSPARATYLRISQSQVHRTGVPIEVPWPTSSPANWSEEWSLGYDAKQNLIVSTQRDGTVVPLPRESLWYCLELLAKEDPELTLRANQIIEKVLTAQQTAIGNEAFGMWPAQGTEPVNKLKGTDDNFVEFMTMALLRILATSEQKLAPETVRKMDFAVARSTWPLMRRDTTSASTNMQVMNPCALAMIAARYSDEETRVAALSKLARLDDRLNREHRIDEYVSPTYNLVALEGLASAITYCSDRQTRALIEKCRTRIWDHFSSHWHAPTGQLAGPMSRCYQTLLPPKERRVIEHFLTPTAPGGCPSQFLVRFQNPNRPRLIKETFIPPTDRVLNNAFLGGLQPIVGTTYLTPTYSLSSVSFGDFWGQRRPFLLYYGTRDNPGFVRFQFLVDGKDFCGAQWIGAQTSDALLGVIQLATNGGTDHPDHKIQNGSLEWKTMSFRITISDVDENSGLSIPSDPDGLLKIPLRGVVDPLLIQIPISIIGELNKSINITRKGKSLVFDLNFVRHDSERRANITKLTDLRKALLAIQVKVGGNISKLRVKEDQTADIIKFTTDELEVSTSIQPTTIEEIHRRTLIKR